MPNRIFKVTNCEELDKSEPKGWEERFDTIFDHYNPIHKFDKDDIPIWNDADYEQIKSFIATEIQKSRDIGYEEGARKQAELDADAIQKAREEEYNRWIDTVKDRINKASYERGINEVDCLISAMYRKRANKPLDERSDGGWMLDELRDNLNKLKK